MNFHMLWATSAQFGQHAHNMKLTTECAMNKYTYNYVINFACAFFYKSSATKHNTGNRKNLSKNAIHNLGWNVTISAHIYRMNYSYNTHLHT
jgi:hypothetical protein